MGRKWGLVFSAVVFQVNILSETSQRSFTDVALSYQIGAALQTAAS
jgi:hypothetical protein